MKKTVWLLLLLLTSACNGLRAQTFNLQTGRETVASLDGLWRFHTGDDPRWADPNFDDSHWPLLRSDRSWTEQGYPDYGGYAWYRFTIQVPDGSNPTDLLLTEIHTGYQVYANGSLIGGAGSTAPRLDADYALYPMLYRLPTGSASRHNVVIALRVWNYRPFASWRGGGTAGPGNAAGSPALLARFTRLDRAALALDDVNDYAYCLLATLVGLTILALFWLRPEDREYLWFAILLLASAVASAFGLSSDRTAVPVFLNTLLSAIAGTVSMVAMLVFLSIVLHLRRSFLWWAVCIALVLNLASFVLFSLHWTSWGVMHALGMGLSLPANLWIIAALAVCALRKDTSARLLLAPITLLYGLNLLGHLAYITVQLGWRAAPFVVDLPLLSHPFPLSLDDVVNYLFILALLIFLVRRFSLARQEETRLSTEMEAARSVQSFLVPATAPLTPGFHVESVYLPATEVGGDFFHVEPSGDGSLLVVIGDVSGKGLKAAMTVSAIVGGLKQIATRNPAEVLAALNRQLAAELAGGFVTCCAALLSPQGRLTLANAGHLSPYCNGKELTVEGGLPLGIDAESRYEETEHKFAPGDRLILISDGVVEARDAEGELYGFARTQHISAQPASTIADTVKRFGQEDDITVVAITRTADLKNTADVRATPSPSVTV